jgi:hypothetical protein
MSHDSTRSSWPARSYWVVAFTLVFVPALQSTQAVPYSLLLKGGHVISPAELLQRVPDE